MPDVGLVIFYKGREMKERKKRNGEWKIVNGNGEWKMEAVQVFSDW